VIIMQLISVVLCVLGASAILAAPADPTGTAGSSGGCPGGYAEGAEIERGRLVYTCQGGRVVPKGCIAEDLTRLPVGGHYDNSHYRRSCVASGETLTFEATGCVQNGQEHAAGSSWDDGKNFFTCKQNAAGAEPQLVSVNQGCIDAGKHVAINEKTQKEDGLYVCEKDENEGSRLVQAGCVKDGKAYNAGDAIESGKFWYNCSRIGRTKFAIKAAGCVQDGKRINDGERYFQNDVVYECSIVNDKTEVRATGCVQSEGSTVERKLGCTWVEGTAPFQYEIACQHDPATNTAKKVPVRCNYNVGGGVYNIDPGCYRVVEKSAFGCVKEGDNLKIQSFQGDDAEKAATGAGLHAC
jgi:hypothetical protein